MAVLAGLIALEVPQPLRVELNFFALSMWLWGGMLYIWMMSLIFYRYTFFEFSPADLSPPYWINMGAMAISALAGSLLIINAPDAPFLGSMLPFIKGRSEEHTSELQSLMRNSDAVFCLKKKNNNITLQHLKT